MNDTDLLAPQSPQMGKSKQRSHSAATVQRGLMAVAAANGNARMASVALAQDGIDLSHDLLYSWKSKVHAEQYQRVRAELLPQIRERQADAHRALELRQLETSLEATQLIQDRLPKMEDRDLINAQGKADIGSGIHAEKALLLDGQPTQIIRRDASDVIRKLKNRGFDFEGEVVSEEDAEVVE